MLRHFMSRIAYCARRFDPSPQTIDAGWICSTFRNDCRPDARVILANQNSVDTIADKLPDPSEP